jgi:hypothetical protein
MGEVSCRFKSRFLMTLQVLFCTPNRFDVFIAGLILWLSWLAFSFDFLMRKIWYLADLLRLRQFYSNPMIISQFSLDLCNKTRHFHFFVGIASNILGISRPDQVYFDCWILLLIIWCLFKKLLFWPVSQFATNFFPRSIFSLNLIGLQNLCALQLFFFIGAVCTLHPTFLWRRSILRGYSVSSAPIVSIRGQVLLSTEFYNLLTLLMAGRVLWIRDSDRGLSMWWGSCWQA